MVAHIDFGGWNIRRLAQLVASHADVDSRTAKKALIQGTQAVRTTRDRERLELTFRMFGLNPPVTP